MAARLVSEWSTGQHAGMVCYLCDLAHILRDGVEDLSGLVRGVLLQYALCSLCRIKSRHEVTRILDAVMSRLTHELVQSAAPPGVLTSHLEARGVVEQSALRQRVAA
jgi:hypothetical protein